ncbi:MAG: T9SS type A sorting domain-containing protein [Actinobacteria bacterium]|nr:T9SS type A sorting domain-containing protein [Actinomycetota bacterium]
MRETAEPGVYEADLVQMALLGQAILNTGGPDGLGNVITPYRKPLNNPHYSQYSTLEMGQKVVLNTVDKVRDFPGVFARYCENSAAHSPSCSQGCADVNGCGIMLIECRQQGTEKGLWTQAKVIADIFWATFLAYADNSIYDIDIGPTDSWDMGANYNAIPVQQSVRAPATTTTTTPPGPPVIKVKNTTNKQWNIVVKDELGNEVQTGLVKNGQTWTSSNLGPGWYMVRATEKNTANTRTAGFNMPDCSGNTVLEIRFY